MKLTDSDFYRLVDYMKKNYGINLSKKRVLIEGRLSNMVMEMGFTNFKDYIDFAFSDKTGAETIKLVNKLTTNHTFFLREPAHFDFLKETILPYLEKTVADHDLRIWCAASSTGQEPYTLAMTIDEYFGSRKSLWDCRILATDLDTDVLKTAKLGIYTTEQLGDVPDRWIKKYFRRVDTNKYQVIDSIREQVVFKQFNLMDKIIYKKPYDLISCRNVMIYFEQATKDALIERFYDCTKNGGYLFIGHAESVSKDSRYKHIKPAIYRKMEGGIK